MNADRLRQLRNNFTLHIGAYSPQQWHADLLALIDSAIQPTGEVGECPEDAPNGVFGRTDLPNVTVYTVRASAIGGFENDIDRKSVV